MKDFSRLVFGKELISLAESNDFIMPIQKAAQLRISAKNIPNEIFLLV